MEKIVFVGKRPPDISKRAQSGSQISQQAIIDLFRDAVKSLCAEIVGIKQNQVCFNVHLSERQHTVVNMLKISGVKYIIIPPVMVRFGGVIILIVGIPFYFSSGELDFDEQRLDDNGENGRFPSKIATKKKD
ncbi:MAG: hypothetical protein IAF02_03565 [Anaerolineae bacterium]|nr:hypothetical protein [Anaerolineae bacterium]